MEKQTMRIIIAPQSLKGSLTAAEAGQAIAAGVETVYPEAEIDIVPIADGGEGAVQALVDATGGGNVAPEGERPLGGPGYAFFGLAGGGRTAALENGDAAGFRRCSG